MIVLIIVLVLTIIAIIIVYNYNKWSQNAVDDCILIAMEKNDLDALRVLIDRWEIKINQKILNWKSLLIVAAMYWRKEIVEFLVNEWAKINFKDDKNWTALSYVYASVLNRLISIPKCKIIARFLLKNWANPNLKNADWRTATMYAVWINNSDILDDLKKYWADFNIKDNKGITPNMVLWNF